MLEAFRLGREVEKEEFLRSKDYLIIFCKASIFSVCIVYIASTAAVMADMTAFAIGYLTAEIMSTVRRF